MKYTLEILEKASSNCFHARQQKLHALSGAGVGPRGLEDASSIVGWGKGVATCESCFSYKKIAITPQVILAHVAEKLGHTRPNFRHGL